MLGPGPSTSRRSVSNLDQQQRMVLGRGEISSGEDSEDGPLLGAEEIRYCQSQLAESDGQSTGSWNNGANSSMWQGPLKIDRALARSSAGAVWIQFSHAWRHRAVALIFSI
jgi:hypothetical protein